MSDHSSKNDERRSLIDAAMNESITAEQAADLQTLLENDRETCEMYAEYARIEAELHLLARGRMANQAVCRGIGSLSASAGPASDGDCFEFISPASSHSVPGFSGGVWQGTIATFSQTGPLSYLIATVVMAAMLLGAWAYKINSHDHIVDLKTPPVRESDANRCIAQVTGMKDCRSTDGMPIYLGSSAALGRKYTLASGLLEITYRNGARVILEGSCSYTVDSDAGGYLKQGKLVARVEKRGERREERGGLAASAAGAKHRAANLQSPAPSPQSLASLFSVTTPTAIVTDLGTEFGVEVNESGDTTSHVFQGTVRVEAVGGIGSASGARSVVLHENDSVVVLKARLSKGVRGLTPAEKAALPKFVRRIYDLPKELDLLDIVAGGNGTGRQRERGVDPTTGMEDPILMPHKRDGNGKYRLVKWHDLIDGVFVPDGRAGAVQIDSAGHAFDKFPETCGETWGSIWARDAEVKRDEVFWIYSMGKGEQFMPQGRGLLCLCSNVGITFSIEAMRNRFPDVRPARFRATVGMVDARYWKSWAESLADVWIFVDGRLKTNRLKLKPEDGTFNVDLKLGPRDRFLTIVMTEGGNGRMYDWLVFGDPVIEMAAADPEMHEAK